MKTLISGSFAYDTIMVYRGRFRDDILPDQVHILNVSFLVPEMRREFGGCAGNIAYTLSALGGDALPMGTVGRDFSPYADWMDECGVSRDQIRVIDDQWTAQAYITTDLDDNQITAFHPGAMNQAHEQTIPDGVALGIVSPNGRDGMLQHAEQFAANGIPFLFDPGQGLPMFDGDDLRQFIDRASHIIVNDYEFQMLRERTGLNDEQMASHVEALIITRGAEGSVIHSGGEVIEIPALQAERVTDPTGCGDAYRGGLLWAMGEGMDWATAGRVGALVAAVKVAEHGTQNHRVDRESVDARFKDAFGYGIA